MKIEVKDIGIIRQASVICDGVTVITGKNGSGKSTLGKAVASLFAGFMNAPRYYVKGNVAYAQKKVRELLRKWPFSDFSYVDQGDHPFKSLFRFARMSLADAINPSPYVALLNEGIQSIESNRQLFEAPSPESREVWVLSQPFADAEEALREFGSIRDKLASLNSDRQGYRDYLESYIRRELNLSFHGQVTPIAKKDSDASIIVSEGDTFVEYSYAKSSLSSNGDVSLFGDAFYVDDASMIERVGARVSTRNPAQEERGVSTKELSSILLDRLKPSENALFGMANKPEFDKAFKLVNEIYPFDLVYSKGTLLTTNGGINIANEASGRKIFALLKLIMNSQLLLSPSLFIFDEPENHLHPEWQIKLAKLLCELSRVSPAKFVCITHSPTLLLAFDVLGRKGNLHVYFSDANSQDDQFADVTGDIARAHKEINDPYIFLDASDE